MRKLVPIFFAFVGIAFLAGTSSSQQPQKTAKELQAEVEKLIAERAAEKAAQQKKEEDPPAEYGRGYIPPTAEEREASHAAAMIRHGDRLKMMAQNQVLPPSFDCKEKGWVIPVGNQASCGSCYLYSTIYGTLTQAFVKAGYGKPDGSLVMAVQYGMDRPRNFGGCGGGNGTEVIAWVMKNGWIAETYVDTAATVHNDYPKYTASSGSDRTKPGAKIWKIGNWGYATGDQSNRPATADEIKTALYNYGPLNVSLAASGQFSNGTGTITSLGTNIDHEIELVAYDDSDKTFMLKNQWSTSWGNGGYRKLTYAAASRLVDVFWVSVDPLPPPPSTIVVGIGDGQAVVGAAYAVMPIATGGTAPYTWSFDWGDGKVSVQPSHVYTAAGKFTVTATAKDSTGAVGTGTGNVVVTADPIPPTGLVVTIPNGAAQVGVPYTIAPVITGSTAPLTWSINYGDGSVVSSSLTHTYSRVGTFGLSATVIDAKGQLGTAKSTVAVTSGPTPPPPGSGITITLQGTVGNDGTYILMPTNEDGSITIGGIRYVPAAPVKSLAPPMKMPLERKPQSKAPASPECGCSFMGICRCEGVGGKCVCGSCSSSLLLGRR